MDISKATAIIASAVLLCGCAGSRSSAETGTETTSEPFVTIDAEPETIVNPHFRNILWRMSRSHISLQEGRYPDHTYDDALFYEDIEFCGMNCRLIYYLDEEGHCNAAEYTCLCSYDPADIINAYLDELYCTPTEDPKGGDAVYRSLWNADIYFSEEQEETGYRIHVRFEMPEDFRESYHRHTMEFDENGDPVTNYEPSSAASAADTEEAE